MNERARQLAADIEADGIDRVRDRQFYEQPDRFISPRDIDELADVLLDTDDDIAMGLSQIGIDPVQFDDEDIDAIVEELAEQGFYFDGECWTHDVS